MPITPFDEFDDEPFALTPAPPVAHPSVQAPPPLSAQPSIEVIFASVMRPRWQTKLLQAGQHLTSIAIVALVGGLACAGIHNGLYWYIVLSAFLVADLSLMLTMLALALRNSPDPKTRRRTQLEAVGLILANVCLIVPTVAVFWLTRTNQLDALINRWIGA